MNQGPKPAPTRNLIGYYEAKRILEEYSRRNLDNLLQSALFPNQREFIKDPSRLKAALCTRRAGKSYAMGMYFFLTAKRFSNINMLYIGLTRESAMRIMYKDIIKFIAGQFKIPMHFNHSKLTAFWKEVNNCLYILGMDDNEKEQEKALGQKYKLIVIDEAASFHQDLREIVYDKLRPTTIDEQGTICLIGTPSNNTKSFFYDVTTGKEPQWSIHKWSAYDNPHIAVNFQNEIKELTKANPQILETSGFKQMYRGEWAINDEALVYAYDPLTNDINEIPSQVYHYVLGVDLGYNDSSAFVIGAYNTHDSNMYIIHAYKESKMIISDVANKIKELQTQFRIHKIIIDGANKQGVEEIKQRYQIPLTIAEKQAKVDFISVMNSDFLCGKIKLLQPKCKYLQREYQSLIWDEKKLRSGKKEELAGLDNHLADAALYAWRYCYNYLSQPKEKPLDPRFDIERLIELESAKLMAIDKEEYLCDY